METIFVELNAQGVITSATTSGRPVAIIVKTADALEGKVAEDDYLAHSGNLESVSEQGAQS